MWPLSFFIQTAPRELHDKSSVGDQISVQQWFIPFKAQKKKGGSVKLNEKMSS